MIAKTGLFVGCMTGTSVDGLDLALIRIGEPASGDHGQEKVDVIAADTLPLPKDLQSALLACGQPESSNVELLGSCDSWLGDFIGRSIRQWLTEIIPGQSKHEVLEAIPFISVEELPVFPGCEGLRGEDRERCFVEMMWNHIQDNFHYPEISREMRTEGKVFVSFVIDAEGRVTQVEAVRGPDKHLKAEGERLLNSMPVMVSPAKQRGKPVPVSYAVPINFQLQ